MATHTWWDYRYDPTTREVTVRRWRQRGNLRPVVAEQYPGLTWAEALDVLDVESSLALQGQLD